MPSVMTASSAITQADLGGEVRGRAIWSGGFIHG